MEPPTAAFNSGQIGRASCRERVEVRGAAGLQAEDGIRDYKVTGVQACALPISPRRGVGIGSVLEDELIERDNGTPDEVRQPLVGQAGDFNVRGFSKKMLRMNGTTDRRIQLRATVPGVDADRLVQEGANPFENVLAQSPEPLDTIRRRGVVNPQPVRRSRPGQLLKGEVGRQRGCHQAPKTSAAVGSATCLTPRTPSVTVWTAPAAEVTTARITSPTASDCTLASRRPALAVAATRIACMREVVPNAALFFWTSNCTLPEAAPLEKSASSR